MLRSVFLPAALALVVLGSTAASATTVLDPVGDFLPSYIGPQNADLDVTSFSVTFNSASSTFQLGATLAGTIDPATVGFYVIGANTGTGTIAPFASIGQPNVRFNQAIVIRKDGTGNIGATVLAPSTISINGNTISANIPLALLPSTGFAPQDYGFNLWPRIGLGNNAQISDFAPENSLISASGAVPEPATWAMMLVGFGMMGVSVRYRRRSTKTAHA